MKTTHSLGFRALTASVSVLGLVGMVLCGAHFARAESSSLADGLGSWEGTGMTTEVGNGPVGPFTITMTRARTSTAGVVRSDGKIHTGDGREIVFWQEKTDRGNGRFQLTSSFGTGVGSCFTNSMCQSLEQRADGHAFASTIAVDGSDKVRVLITELKDGQAVRFYAQTLAKK